MEGRSQKIRRIYDEIIDLPPDARVKYLDEHCAEDPEVRNYVEQLVALDGGTEHVPVAPIMENLRQTPPPKTIGDYRILSPLGEGGFGEVYEAEQTEPFRRRVALKIVKAGMDTKAVLARFDAERQALALMDHTGIAKVYDAGETDRGRSYFVMELIHGEAITTYCDRRRLPIDERLNLFLSVCDAVRHAHQRGIIHRDLKPSNILVTTESDRPLPKVIDFGIAKATGHALTKQTLFTEQGQFMGTPEYMSPEQAEMGGIDVDVRTDVYSLGIVLYELLTGVLPFDMAKLRSSSVVKMQEMIRESEAKRPSTRVSSAGVADPAENRRTSSAKLARRLQGDLDWIVLKALEKERDRRYESAAEFASDIRRCLNDEPVMARPPSAAYRAGKLARRYRVPLSVAAIVLLSIVYALFESNRQRIAAERARDEAEVVTRFFSDMIESVDPKDRGNDVSVREILDDAALTIENEFAEQPLVRARLMSTMGIAYRKLGLFEEAKPLLEQALTIREGALGPNDADVAYAQSALGILLYEEGDKEAARIHFERALAAMEESLEPDDYNAEIYQHLEKSYWAAGDWEKAYDTYGKALAYHEGAADPDPKEISRILNNMGGVGTRLGLYEDSEEHLLRSLRIRKELHGPGHLDVAGTLTNLAFLHVHLEEFGEAAETYRQILAIQQEALGPDHPGTCRTMGGLGSMLVKLGRHGEARHVLEPALAASRNAFPADHQVVTLCLFNLALACHATGDGAAARSYIEEVHAAYDRMSLLERPEGVPVLSAYAGIEADSGNHGNAKSLFLKALAIQEESLGRDHGDLLEILDPLASSLRALGEVESAAKWEARAESIRASVAPAP